VLDSLSRWANYLSYWAYREGQAYGMVL